MEKMSLSEIEYRLSFPLQAVLSVSREGKGPVAVPMSYVFTDGEFRIITSPDSLHGRLMQKTRRATMTVEDEEQHARSVTQWYVMAEGPIAFTNDNPEPVLRAIMAKDRGEKMANEWTEQSMPNVLTVAVLAPETLSGYIGTSRLD